MKKRVLRNKKRDLIIKDKEEYKRRRFERRMIRERLKVLKE